MSEHLKNRAEVVGLWAGTLAATEVGLGSVLHGLHIPLAGTMLSLNQAAFLSRATRQESDCQTVRTLPLEISSITAVLKSFSPIGKKLTPMLAITTQGALFTAAIYICGANLLGVMIGSALLATWGIIQPVALASFMFWALSDADQTKILSSWQKITAELAFMNSENIIMAVSVFLMLKCSLAVAIAAATWTLGPEETSSWFSSWVGRLTLAAAAKGPLPVTTSSKLSPTVSRNQKSENPLRQALGDLKNPLVFLSLAILAGLALLVESTLVDTFWMTMRAIGAAYVTYVVLRWLPWDRFLNRNSSSQKSLRAAVKQLQSLSSHAPTNSSNTTGQVQL
jgi:hypothetical protein